MPFSFYGGYMHIWLKHPAHGVKCAYLPTEAATDEKNGWERFDPNAGNNREAEKQDMEMVEDEPKKRGRPAKNQG